LRPLPIPWEVQGLVRGGIPGLPQQAYCRWEPSWKVYTIVIYPFVTERSCSDQDELMVKDKAIEVRPGASATKYNLTLELQQRKTQRGNLETRSRPSKSTSSVWIIGSIVAMFPFLVEVKRNFLCDD